MVKELSKQKHQSQPGNEQVVLFDDIATDLQKKWQIIYETLESHSSHILHHL